MEILALTREQSRAIDGHAIEHYGFTGLVLMENAGRGCVDVLECLGIDGPVVIVCGKGNNAGDGFVIARHLAIRGYECQVLLLSPPSELRGDAAANFAILQKVGVPIVELGAGDFVAQGPPRLGRPTSADDPAWIVDAVLGTGATGNPRPPFDAAIDWMNARAATTKLLAVDVPSGLDCDSGEPSSHTVRADHTCTFVAMKVGFTSAAARQFTGEVHVCDIGVPLSVFRDVQRT